jgi:hypothetical protein
VRRTRPSPGNPEENSTGGGAFGSNSGLIAARPHRVRRERPGQGRSFLVAARPRVGCGWPVTVVVGGVKHNPQVRALARGVDVLVATPGRLLDHLQGGTVRLDRTEIVVLDEADHMLDLGFLVPIRRILAKLPKSRQTLFFSATMPKDIGALARDMLTDPVEVSVAPSPPRPSGSTSRSTWSMPPTSAAFWSSFWASPASIARWSSPAPSTAPTR